MNNTFYFSHDYNARTDEKIKRLIRKYWMEWYWTYWAIVEDLYQNANALQLDCEWIAYDMRVPENIVDYIVNDSWLFIVEYGVFYSKSIQKRLDERDEKSSKARESARKRWDKGNANALQTQSDSNAIKERKGKENKGKEIENKEIKHKYWEFSKVLISDSEYKKLEIRYDKKDLDELIEKLDIYIWSKWVIYKSHYLTIINWAKKKWVREFTQQEREEQKQRAKKREKILKEKPSDLPSFDDIPKPKKTISPNEQIKRYNEMKKKILTK